MSIAASHSRGIGWEWAQAAILAANLAWTTLCFGGTRPETMVVTTALTGLLLAVHLIGFARQCWRVHPAGWLMLPFIAYAAANVVWVTPVPWLGWLDWIGWMQMVAVFWVVLNGVRSPGPRRGLLISILGVAAGSALLACVQQFGQTHWLMFGRIQPPQYHGRASGPFGIPNCLAALLLLFLPSLGWLGFRQDGAKAERVWGRGLTLLLALGFVLTFSRGGWLALALALTVWPLIAVREGWWQKLQLAAAALGAVFLAGGILFAVLPVARERFGVLMRDTGERSRPIMWRAAWELFRAEPAWGTGGGSYNILFERHRPEQFHDETQWAHNDYLNTLSDYGAVGFGLFFGPCAMITIRSFARRRPAADGRSDDWIDDPMFACALGVGLFAFSLQMLVDFHLKIPALALTSATLAALTVGALWPPRQANESRSPGAKVGIVFMGLCSAGIFAFGIVPHYRGEALRYRGRQAIDQLALSPPSPAGYRTALSWIKEDLVRAVTLAPANGQAWSDLSYATSLSALADPTRTAEFGREAEAAADRALAISEVPFEFWIRRGVARDMMGRWLEGGNDFTHATSIAPRNAVAWFYYADHLSRKSTERGMALAALGFCLRLDPGNPAGLALRQRLAISQAAP